ncbi:MAG: PQQ-binding-like beta-propeller repeat protein [Sedimentisphaerales bacterium]|nr:PQQ-binding-like beta-propeller repeat protein [Sedimentisphaerales bacterium]
MASTKRLTIMVACCVVLVGAGIAAAQDWPQWLGPNRDARVSDFDAPEQWPAELTQKWKIAVGAGDATPALVGDRLYVFTRQGDEEVIMCLNASDGKDIWQDRYTAREVTGAAARHPGPRSSVTVTDGKVITLGVGGILSCLDASGKVLWRNDKYTGVPQFFTSMSPIVVDGMCIAHLGGRDDGAIVAFDLASGDEKWKWTGEGPSYASPVVMTVGGVKQVVVQTEQSLLGLAVSDGSTVLWQIATPAQRRFYNAATPIIAGPMVIYTGQGQGTKAAKIEKQGDKFNVTELWTNSDLGTQYNTPVLKNGLLFGLSNDGLLFCLNAETGKTAWTDTTKRQGFGCTIDAGSVLLALSSDSQLVVFKPDGEQFNEVASYKVAETPVYACPVASGNRIYVKDQDSLTLWTVD